MRAYDDSLVKRQNGCLGKVLGHCLKECLGLERLQRHVENLAAKFNCKFRNQNKRNCLQ